MTPPRSAAAGWISRINRAPVPESQPRSGGLENGDPSDGSKPVQFSFRTTRELRKRANRASLELEVPLQELASEAIDEYLKARSF
ncbi:MAG: hypothetical protein ACRDV9_10285 [Acidimicrobiia bacterium]